MAKKPGRKGSADPMVPVYSPKLRAAMTDQGLRVADVARDLKINRQTMAYLAAGDGTKRSRASRRARLAKLLNVTEQWLAEPTATYIPLFASGGVLTVPSSGMFASPRTQLAVRRLLEKCVAATTRDLSKGKLRDVGIKEVTSIDDVLQHVSASVRNIVDLDEARFRITMHFSNLPRAISAEYGTFSAPAAPRLRTPRERSHRWSLRFAGSRRTMPTP